LKFIIEKERDDMYCFEDLQKKLVPNKPANVYLPNEIFNDLKYQIDIDKPKSSSQHIAYAYCYVYLISYLYRNTLSVDFKETELKKILGLPSSNKLVNYITKKNGLLNQMGYIKKTTDFPLKYYLDEENTLIFEMYSDLDEVYKENRKNNTINLPLKAFHRTIDSLQEKILDGYFYEFVNTHKVPIEIFTYCLSNHEIGVIGFYIYCYLKHKNDMYKQGYSSPLEKLIHELGLKKTTVNKYLKVLEEYNMISNDHKPFVVNLQPSKQVYSCTYKTNGFNSFVKDGKKNKVIVRRVISEEFHDKNYDSLERVREDFRTNPFLDK
jgi:DNA-binding MarR family transcriptional regulator